MTKAKRGAYAAAITPLDARGEPDADKLARYCRRLLERGLDGVAPIGTTGEGASVPMRFRLEAPAAFAEHGFRADEVIFGTGSCAVGDAVEATRAVIGAGFANVLVLPPFYFKNVSDEGLYAYYARLIESVGDARLRVYLYHFPQMSMTPISIPLIERLKRDFGSAIAGLKDSSGDYEGTLAFARAAEEFDVFPSNEGVLLRAMAEGCAGVISATTNAGPHIARRALDAEGEAAETAQALLGEVRALIAKHPLSPALKRLEAWRSGDEGWLALLPPQIPLSVAAEQALRADLEAIEPRAGLLGA
ncbi:MAG: dihydrodipicolinate synthase family protein [Pseudomonadota bacterium]